MKKQLKGEKMTERKNNKRIGYITAILSAIMMIALCVIGANATDYDFPEGSASVNVTYNGRRVLEGEAPRRMSQTREKSMAP